MRPLHFLSLLLLLACQNPESSKTQKDTITNSSNLHILGLIGGTSWHSTIDYYRSINESVNAHYGNNTNPPLLVYTMNQAQVHQYQVEDNWEGIADMLTEGAERLINGGAEQVMFCANTPHKVYAQVAANIDVPILHIADATAASIQASGLKKVCFLGTKYTMTEDFITQRIADSGIDIVAPSDSEEVVELHRIIIEELTYNKIVPDSKQYVLDVIQSFVEQGVEGVILGCTEFPLMIFEEDLSIPIFNTTEIHAQAGVKFVLGDS